MATYGWGRCYRCGAMHQSLIMRGPCERCLERDRQRVFFDRIATPEKLRHHPDLAELEAMLEGFYA